LVLVGASGIGKGLDEIEEVVSELEGRLAMLVVFESYLLLLL